MFSLWCNCPEFFDHCRVTRYDGVFRHILGYYRARRDNGMGTDANAWQDDHARADPYVVADHHGPAGRAALFPHRDVRTVKVMAAGKDGHFRAEHHIVADNGIVPDPAVGIQTRVIPDHHILSAAEAHIPAHFDVFACAEEYLRSKPGAER